MKNEKKYNFAIVSGIILAINTLIFNIVEIRIPFLGVYSIKFFEGLSNFVNFSKDIKKISDILIFSGIVLLLMAGGFVYSGIKKNRKCIKYLAIINTIFIIIFYIVLLKKIPNDIRDFVSFSFFKILLYILSLGLAFSSYFMTANKEG